MSYGDKFAYVLFFFLSYILSNWKGHILENKKYAKKSPSYRSLDARENWKMPFIKETHSSTAHFSPKIFISYYWPWAKLFLSAAFFGPMSLYSSSNFWDRFKKVLLQISIFENSQWKPYWEKIDFSSALFYVYNHVLKLLWQNNNWPISIPP